MDIFDDESICRRCGWCCVEKFIAPDHTVIFTDFACEFRDPQTMLCTVYSERLTKFSRCVTARKAAEVGVLLQDCPYVQGIADYPKTALLSDRPDLLSMAHKLFPERYTDGESITKTSAEMVIDRRKHKK